MIELEVFQREPESGVHEIKLWVGNIIVCQGTYPEEHLSELRDSLHNELLWLNRYLRDKGIDS
jgi:hypothetical protein